MGETFICQLCEQTFEKGWSDKDAEAEKDALWGDVPLDDCGVVCDDCWQQINPFKVVSA